MTHNGGDGFELTLPLKVPYSPGPKRSNKTTSQTRVYNIPEDQKSLVSVPIQWLCPETRIPFTIYARPSPNKVFMILGPNRIYTHGYYSKLIKIDITKCYIKKKSIPELLYYVDNNIDTILSNKGVPSTHRANLFYHTALRRTKKAFTRPGRESFLKIREIVATMLEDILEDKETMSALFMRLKYNHHRQYKQPIYTFIHSLNVGILATYFVKKLLKGIDPDNLEMIGLGFFLHNIGMLKVPGQVTNKETSLDKNDWAIIKQHPKWGYEIMSRAGNITPEVAHIIMEHHERPNGKGYPFQLKGERIHLLAKICAIVDTFDALISERGYKKAASTVEALKTIRERTPYEYDRDLFSRLIIFLLDGGLIKG